MAAILCAGLFAGIIAAPLGNRVNDLVDYSVKYVVHNTYLQIDVDIVRSPKTAYALLQTIRKHNPNSNREELCDNLIYAIADGDYIVQWPYIFTTHPFLGPIMMNIHIVKTEDKIQIWVNRILIDAKRVALGMLFGYAPDILQMSELKAIVNAWYDAYNHPDLNITFFTSDGDRWSYPIFRKPRIFNNVQFTQEMASVAEDLTNFANNQSWYESNGHPYRRGYLFHGGAGTGKTTMIEFIGQKQHMNIYLINLNARHMTDTILVNLISKVPAMSLIVFEEIDKQLRNPTKVTIGGILTAIDGPQRLSSGTIVVMTANNRDFLNDVDSASMFRAGRIDVVKEFSAVLS